MAPDSKKRHTDREYEQQLAALRNALLLMAGRVEKMTADSMRALVARDSELARRTIEADHLVNRAEVDADELCLLILARRQPMASDLRFITLALKMVTDLERIGDLAVNICERAIDLAAQGPAPPPPQVERMSIIVQAMVRDAIDAFVEGDADKAQRVVDRDDEVDDLYGEAFESVLERMRAESAFLQRGIHLLSVAKWLERMADHGTNLAEQVIFMIKGKDIRHVGKLDQE